MRRDDILGQRRFARLSTARKIVCVLARRLPLSGQAEKPGVLTLDRIGRALGGRDHTTVMHLERQALIYLTADTEHPTIRRFLADVGWVVTRLLRAGFALPVGIEDWHIDHSRLAVEPRWEGRLEALGVVEAGVVVQDEIRAASRAS